MNPGNDRITEFDAMRGIGMFGVFLWHGWWIKPTFAGAVQVGNLLEICRIALEMFFVVSGYLITGILMRSRGREGYFRRFYVRRALRILPAYYAVLAVLFLVLPQVDPRVRDSHLTEYFPWYALHLQNWLFTLVQPDLGWPATNHFWSLAVEEQFYLAWPAVVMLTPPQHFRRLCVAMFAVCLLNRLIVVLLHGPWVVVYMSTFTRVDGMAAGALIATLGRAEALSAARPVRWLGIAAGTAILLLPQIYGVYDVAGAALTATAATVFFAAIVLQIHAGADVPARRLLRSRVFIWFGGISYGFYLLHYPVVYLVRDLALRHPGLIPLASGNFKSFLLMLASLAISVLLALLMYHGLERPALNLKRRWAPDLPRER